MNVLGLLQLCDATEPYYSHSLRVDSPARRLQLQTPDGLAELVCHVLQTSVAPAEGAASGVAFRAARAGDLVQVPALCAVMTARPDPPEIKLASVHTGQRLWEVSRRWDWTGGIHQQYDPLVNPGNLHHAVAFGTLISETTTSQIRAIAAYLFSIAKSLVYAAIRVIPVDEAIGQRALTSVQPAITQLAAACADKSPADIHRIAPPFLAP
jgi:urease accessory protein UreF